MIEELQSLGLALFPGALGENLTTRGLDRRALRCGQRFRVGEAALELVRMRTLCATLDAYGAGIQSAISDAQGQAGEPASPRWGLSGFYASVIQPGVVSPGDAITLLD